MRARTAGGHPSRTPPAPPTMHGMQLRQPIRQRRLPSPRPDSPTSIMHARHSCASDLCISAFVRRIVALFPPTPMKSRAHLLSCPPFSRQKRIVKDQGERGGGIGQLGRHRGLCPSAILRARAQALFRRPCRPPGRPGEPQPWFRGEPQKLGERLVLFQGGLSACRA
jgi:hypothetical protein